MRGVGKSEYIWIATKLFLLAVIPLCTLGFNAFQESAPYSRIFNLSGVESALGKRLTTQMGEPQRAIISRDRFETVQDFTDLWKLIRTYSDRQLPTAEPELISRMAVQNDTYVEIPKYGKVVLIPESVPIFALYCSEANLAKGLCKDENAIMIGTVADVRKWMEAKHKKVRSIIDLIISALSISLGLLLEFKFKRTEQAA